MKHSCIAQFFFNFFLRLPAKKNLGLFRKLQSKSVPLLRIILIRCLKDPLVIYNLDGFDILIPLSHDLPYIRKQFPHYSTNVARIACLLRDKYPDMTLVDIGANIGDTVAILRNYANFPILCIDGDGYFFSILEHNVKNIPNVELINTFVGDKVGKFSGSIEAIGGTGHLVENQESNQTIELKKLSNILLEAPKFLNAKMIKIDTDGFDCKILNSELSLLEKLKPVIFFEYDPYFFNKFLDNGFKVFSELQKIGYKVALIYENTGEYLMHLDLSNHLLLEDIHHFYSGWSGKRYCDICVFHQEDYDVFTLARLKELEFFKMVRLDENSI